LAQDFLGVALIEVISAGNVEEGTNPYFRYLLERLFGKVFDERCAQCLPIVLPEVDNVVSPS